MHPLLLLQNIEPIYTTGLGAAYCCDSLYPLSKLPDNSINLIITSPPFALLRKKEYGNENQDNYIQWISQFGEVAYKKLKTDGSLVIDIGGAYQKGSPTRSLYNFKLAIHFVEELGYFLAEDFYWYNPAKLPSPIEWVNKRKIRVKDSVNNVWWFSKTEYPKADVTKVLAPYSDRMKKLLDNPGKYYEPKKRPSGHNIGESFGKNNGGAIPSNLLQIPNSESNSKFISRCHKFGISSHPARFPSKLPKFFIDLLTEEEDIVVDIFAGSNTTGEVAQNLNRRWLSFEINREYAAASVFRFLNSEYTDTDLEKIYRQIFEGKCAEIKDHSLFTPLPSEAIINSSF